MPRRRMFDPSFTDDIEVAQLTRDERLFLVGCLRNTDDEGRLNGHIVFLKSQIFMYDDDIDLKRMQEIKESTLKKMEDWHADNIWRLRAYQNSGQDYICFPNWYEFNKPSHPTPSKLPAPPPEQITSGSGKIQEIITSKSGEALETLPKPSALGQVSQGQVSIGQVRGVQEDFTKFLDNEKDLTDSLRTTLTKYLPARPAFAFAALHKLWRQALGHDMNSAQSNFTHDALKKYAPEVIAEAYAKAVKYGGGRAGSWKYLQKILEEKARKDHPP